MTAPEKRRYLPQCQVPPHKALHWPPGASVTGLADFRSPLRRQGPRRYWHQCGREIEYLVEPTTLLLTQVFGVIELTSEKATLELDGSIANRRTQPEKPFSAYVAVLDWPIR